MAASHNKVPQSYLHSTKHYIVKEKSTEIQHSQYFYTIFYKFKKVMLMKFNNQVPE